MKNIFFSLAFLATLAVSCEKQEATESVQETVEVDTVETEVVSDSVEVSD